MSGRSRILSRWFLKWLGPRVFSKIVFGPSPASDFNFLKYSKLNTELYWRRSHQFTGEMMSGPGRRPRLSRTIVLCRGKFFKISLKINRFLCNLRERSEGVRPGCRNAPSLEFTVAGNAAQV